MEILNKKRLKICLGTILTLAFGTSITFISLKLNDCSYKKSNDQKVNTSNLNNNLDSLSDNELQKNIYCQIEKLPEYSLSILSQKIIEASNYIFNEMVYDNPKNFFINKENELSYVSYRNVSYDPNIEKEINKIYYQIFSYTTFKYDEDITKIILLRNEIYDNYMKFNVLKRAELNDKIANILFLTIKINDLSPSYILNNKDTPNILYNELLRKSKETIIERLKTDNSWAIYQPNTFSIVNEWVKMPDEFTNLFDEVYYNVSKENRAIIKDVSQYEKETFLSNSVKIDNVYKIKNMS